jgi:phage terminase large subunit GpA-like protein
MLTNSIANGVKGLAGPRPIWPTRSSRTKDNSQVYMLGVDTAKDVIYSRLRLEKSGAGYVHFPVGGAFDGEYFAQLTSEAVQTRYREGRPYRVWVPIRDRNEALDTAVYALAARHATRIQVITPRPTASRPPPIEVDADDPPEGGPSVLPGRREVDPNFLHQAYAAATGPQAKPSWVNSGRIRGGSWINPRD